MSESTARQIGLGALLEGTFVASLVAGFLYIYTRLYAGPAESIGPHLSLIATLWLGVLSLRLAICKWAPGALARWSEATVLAIAITGLLGGYALILTGLQYWGRVITYEMLRVYVPQTRRMLEVLGFSPLACAALFALMFVALVAAFAKRPRRLHWVAALAGRTSHPIAATACMAAGLIVAILVMRFAAFAPAAQREPVSLIFFPQQEIVASIQSRNVAGNRLLEERQAQARQAYVPNPQARKRNIVVIIGDALRAENMSVYGYPRRTTPFFDALASDGALQRSQRMYSVCGESFCGIRAVGESNFTHTMSQNAFTLQEALRRHGYKIHMFLCGDHTNFYGLRESYGAVDSYYDTSYDAEDYMNDDRLVLNRLGRMPRSDGVPVMIQLHLKSTHGIGLRHEKAQVFRPWKNYFAPRARRPVLTPSDPVDEEARNFYDNGVVQFDQFVAEALDTLKAKGYLDDAAVFVTGDHGEMLGERGEYGHSHLVYDPALNIPFLFISFGAPAHTRIDPTKFASQVDIAPTILAELDMPAPASWAGQALQSNQPRDFVYFQQIKQSGLVDLRASDSLWKYWVDTATNDEFAFDLKADPMERHNRIADLPAELRQSWKAQQFSQGQRRPADEMPGNDGSDPLGLPGSASR